MNIITLIKQVPDTAQLSSTVDGLVLMEDDSPRIVNPWDEYTLETAIQLKEAHNGHVTILCMGRVEALEALKIGLAMGADEAILLCDSAFEKGDSLATARVLVAAIQKVGDFDIVVAGCSAIDGNTAATPVQVAALLDLPPISFVSALENVDPQARTISAVRLLDHGRENVTSQLPAVISVVKEINEPRYPSFMGIRKAAQAEIPTWGLSDLDLDASQVGRAGSQVSWPSVSLPVAPEVRREQIEGDPAETARILADKLIVDQII